MTKAKVMLLGSFHFDDQGMDRYKPTHGVDILSAQRQNELEDMLVRLERFKPTKIALEMRPDRQQDVHAEYQAYCAGTVALQANESHQIGYRLARRAQLPTLHCIDVWGRYYDPAVDIEQVAQKYPGPAMYAHLDELFGDDPDGPLGKYAHEHGQTSLLTQHNERIQQDGAAGDAETKARTLRETFIAMNSEQSINASHATYFAGPFQVGVGPEYPGVDYICAWYNRNLRIFANIQRITTSSDDRILLIIGSGHLPILRHCVMSSRDHELVEPNAYLT
jgi:hypothetical protein